MLYTEPTANDVSAADVDDADAVDVVAAAEVAGGEKIVVVAVAVVDATEAADLDADTAASVSSDLTVGKTLDDRAYRWAVDYHDIDYQSTAKIASGWPAPHRQPRPLAWSLLACYCVWRKGSGCFLAVN
jgi:hypothetical protein